MTFHKNWNLGLILVASFYCVCISEGANILLMHTLSSYSHRVSMMPLANTLAEKGHRVTYISPLHGKTDYIHPKIVEIVPEEFSKQISAIAAAEFNVNLRIDKQNPYMFMMYDEIATLCCKYLFENEEFNVWLNNSPKIDLIIVDINPECAVALGHRLNTNKIILYNTVPFWGKYVEFFKLPAESLVTYADLAYKPVSFIERIKNTLLPLAWAFYGNRAKANFDAMVRETLNITDLPDVDDLVENISLVLMTGNYISEQPRSLPPMFVSVPGLHINTTRQLLPEEIEQFINSTDADGNPSDGFVYISLGTLVIAPNLPQRILDVFMNTIRAFPRIRFLWRWNGKALDNTPTNLYMAKWFQQQDILGHPKIKAFVTQAGRPSLQEALTNSVPMITFPILGDQDFNAMRLEAIGASITLEIGEVTEDQFQSALSRILFDNTIKYKVKENSVLFQDLPMKPIDTAVWWTEYVLRHNDFSHLKPLARKQSWYQRRLLDVWAALFLTGIGIILLIGASIYSVGRIVTSSAEPKLKRS